MALWSVLVVIPPSRDTDSGFDQRAVLIEAFAPELAVE